MRIFFDFYEIALGKGKSIGIYNYSIAILNTFAINHKNVQIIVACSEENHHALLKIPSIQLKIITKEYPTWSQRLKWRLINAMREAQKVKADIYFSPKGFAPGLIKRKRKPYIVLTVHDMIPFFYLENYPNYYSKFENIFITRTLKHSVNIANSVITISQYSKQQIEKYCSKQSNIDVIYNGVSTPKSHIQKNLSPYIFAITSALPHKNKDMLVKGYLQYRKIANNPLPLKICGITLEHINVSTEDSKYIECIPFAEPEYFSVLFSNARLFLFLPTIEGFGFPPIESLIYNVPPIVSDIPVLREVLANSAHFVANDDPNSIAEGIHTVLANDTITKNILLNASKIIGKYTWDKCSDELLQTFSKTNNSNY